MTEKYDLSHVKFCMSGAAPLNGELCASLRRILPNATIGQGYGKHCASCIIVIDTQPLKVSQNAPGQSAQSPQKPKILPLGVLGG